MPQHRGVVDDDHAPPGRDRREVGRAQQRPGAEPRRAGREHDLLPRVPGAMGEPGRRPQDRVGAGPERREPRRELARPPLHAAELGPRRGPGVDRDLGHARDHANTHHAFGRGAL
jgi:hypothetical protein